MKFNCTELNVKLNIEQYLDLINKQKSEIAERELIKASLTDSLVAEVRSLMIPYSDKMMREAWLQQDKKKKSERPMYEFIKKDLFERLFSGRKATDIEIIMGGYDSCVYSFILTYEKIRFEIRIPNVRVANSDNISRMSYGKYALYYEEKASTWKYIAYSYDLDDIAKAIEEFVQARKGVNQD